MERYGSITTPVSVPRLIVGAMLAAGVAVLVLAFTQYGLLAGLAVSVIPAALCILWVTLRNPAISMLGLFVVNYFIMALTRYAHDLPFGMILDALIFYNFLIITLQALIRPIEWKRASSGLTVVAAIWMAYCILELVNPESVSVAGWFSSVRSIAFYFFFIVVLTQLTMTEYKYLKYMLAVWSVLTLIAVGKACMQKFFGFNAAENYWLFVLGGRSTHIIHSGVRYFSFFSDAANFGGSMGLSMVVFSISALYYRNSWMKLYLLLVAAAACYGMLISGTRSALAVPFVGYSAFIMMSRNIKMIGAGVFLIIAAFIFLKFTTIGQGNSIIRRARSAFNTNDPSFQVRLANQAKLRELMADKPFGAGLGHGGGRPRPSPRMRHCRRFRLTRVRDGLGRNGCRRHPAAHRHPALHPGAGRLPGGLQTEEHPAEGIHGGAYGGNLGHRGHGLCQRDPGADPHGRHPLHEHGFHLPRTAFRP